MERAAANDRDDAGGEARRWIARLASGATSAEDLQRLQVWLDNDHEHWASFQRERQAWQDLAVLEDDFASHIDANVTEFRPRRYRAVTTGLLAAACVAAVVAMPSALLSLQADFSNSATQTRSITLADGSRAVLDAGSALSVDFGRDTRSITLLKGRAWFEVRHGDPRPFEVRTGNGVIQDVGTAFSVEEDGTEVRVGVTQGAVRVTGQIGAPVLLTVGGQAGYSRDGKAMRLASADTAMIAGWRKGELLMRAMPVRAAIAEIARYRAAPVFVWGDLSAMAPVSGSFRTEKPEDALNTVIVMRGLEQIRLPGGIMILRAAYTE